MLDERWSLDRCVVSKQFTLCFQWCEVEPEKSIQTIRVVQSGIVLRTLAAGWNRFPQMFAINTTAPKHVDTTVVPSDELMWLRTMSGAVKALFLSEPVAFRRVYGLESYSRTSGGSNHHRQSVSDVKNAAIPTEPRGRLGAVILTNLFSIIVCRLLFNIQS